MCGVKIARNDAPSPATSSANSCRRGCDKAANGFSPVKTSSQGTAATDYPRRNFAQEADMEHDHRETTNPALTGIKGLCPRCQTGHLFNAVLSLAPRCEACGLD